VAAREAAGLEAGDLAMGALEAEEAL